MGIHIPLKTVQLSVSHSLIKWLFTVRFTMYVFRDGRKKTMKSITLSINPMINQWRLLLRNFLNGRKRFKFQITWERYVVISVFQRWHYWVFLSSHHASLNHSGNKLSVTDCCIKFRWFVSLRYTTSSHERLGVSFLPANQRSCPKAYLG